MVLVLPLHVHALCTTPECVPRDGWDNFANNLGSDLAPFLALFGEQVTTQYMSESLDWIDNILLALAPLGIITILVSAIRVSGTGPLKSLIGRGKETRGQVETDLMSSTSSDVCELLSGDGVVRVVGTPALLQLIWVPEKVGDSDKSCGLYNFRETLSRNLYYTKKHSDNPQSKLPDGRVNSEKLALGGMRATSNRQEPTPDALIDRNPPNVSLNLSVKSVSRPTLIIFIIIGIIAQGAVLAFAAVSQYVLHFPKNDSKISFYAFPVLCAGTVFLNVGVLLCAHAVESSTGEITWVPKRPGTTWPRKPLITWWASKPEPQAKTFVLWLQRGGQKVGDQEFEAFAQSSKDEIISSYREERGVNRGVNRKALVFVAITFTLLGFIAQLVGLRAAHSSVTVMQMAAIIIVTVFRSSAHFKRDKGNIIKKPQLVEGFELDWLAKYLGGIADWRVDTSAIPAASQQPGTRPVTAAPAASGQPGSLSATGVPPTPRQPGSQPATGVPAVPLNPRLQPATVAPTGSQQRESRPLTARLPARTELISPSDHPGDIIGGGKIQTDKETEEILNYTPQKALEARSRLSELSVDWDLDLRKSVKGLKNAIEMTMNDVYSKMTLKEERHKWLRSSFTWQVPVVVKYKDSDVTAGVQHLIKVNLTRQTDGPDGCSDWKVDEYMLEAVLGLWLSSLIEENRSREKSDENALENIWHIGPATDTFRGEYRVWIRRTAPHKSTKRSDKRMRHFGWPTRGEHDESLYVETDRTLEVICTHQLYFLFLHRLAKDVQMVGGETTTRLEESKLDGGIAAQALSTARLPDFKLMNTNLASIATIFKDYDLGTIEEAYCCIIPAFQKVQKPPYPRENFDAQKQSLDHRNPDKWRSSLGIDIDLYTTMHSIGLSQNEIDTVEEQLYQRLHSFREMFISKYVNAGIYEDIQHLEPMWAGLYLRCKLILPKRPLSSINLDLMVLCLTRYRIKGNYDIKALHQLVSSTIQSLNSKISPDEILRKIEDEDAKTFRDPDLLSRFVWVHARSGRTVEVPQSSSTSAQNINTAQPPKLSADPSSHHTASKVLIEARRKLSYMFTSQTFDKYVNNPTSIERMARMSVTKGFDSEETSNQSLPVDLLLIQGYRTPLQMAAELKNMPIVDMILDFWRKNVGFYVTFDQPAAEDGRTALQAAAGGGHRSIVESLFEAGAPIDAKAAETSGRTALQAATEGGHEEIVQFLIANGANINGRPAPNRGITALEAAAARRNVDIVKLLLKEKADVNPIPSTYGRTPLQAAAEAGHNDVIELLLSEEANANINAPPADCGGRSALQGAAEKGHFETVKLLLNKGANVDDDLPAKEFGCTAFHAAVCSGRGDIVELLLNKRTTTPNHDADSQMRTALYAAVENGHDRVVKVLLDKDAPIYADKTEPNGKTILQVTLQSGNATIIESILKASFDLEAALNHALIEGHEDVTSNLLINDQLDINRSDSQDSDPALLKAATLGHVEVIQWLVARDSLNVNIKNSNGDTALSIAAKAGFILIVEILLGRQYILLNEANNQGSTALTLASSKGHVKVVKALLANPRININAKDRQDKTAFSTAWENMNDEILFLLLNDKRLESYNETLEEYMSQKPLLLYEAVNEKAAVLVERLLERPDIGTQLNAANPLGDTPLMIAVRQQKLDIVRMLLGYESVTVDKTVLSIETSPEIKKLLKDPSRGTNRAKANPPAQDTSTAHTQGASPSSTSDPTDGVGLPHTIEVLHSLSSLSLN
jgi:ankyrin repeat protein